MLRKTRSYKKIIWRGRVLLQVLHCIEPRDWGTESSFGSKICTGSSHTSHWIQKWKGAGMHIALHIFRAKNTLALNLTGIRKSSINEANLNQVSKFLIGVHVCITHAKSNICPMYLRWEIELQNSVCIMGYHSKMLRSPSIPLTRCIKDG